jgi:Amt family ammonium transporter
MIEYYASDAGKKLKPPTSDFAINGLLYGGGFHQLSLQALAAAFIIVINIIGTAIILKVVSFIVPLRASDGDVEGGDLAIHGMDPMPYPVAETANV